MADEQTPEGREFLALDVAEVSLVDAGAIRREFLIVKRLEQEVPGTQKAEDGETDLLQQIAEQRLNLAMSKIKKLSESIGSINAEELRSEFHAVWRLLDAAESDFVTFAKSHAPNFEPDIALVVAKARRMTPRRMDSLGQVIDALSTLKDELEVAVNDEEKAAIETAKTALATAKSAASKTPTETEKAVITKAEEALVAAEKAGVDSEKAATEKAAKEATELAAKKAAESQGDDIANIVKAAVAEGMKPLITEVAALKARVADVEVSKVDLSDEAKTTMEAKVKKAVEEATKVQKAKDADAAPVTNREVLTALKDTNKRLDAFESSSGAGPQNSTEDVEKNEPKSIFSSIIN